MTDTGLVQLLTKRECECVSALVAGHTTNKDLASKLGCATATVGSHIKNVYIKWGVGTRVELVLFVLRRSGMEELLLAHSTAGLVI